MTDEEYIEGLGQAVRVERELLGWSQDELGRRAGLSRSSIFLLEKGSSGTRLGTVRRVAQALGVPLAYLVAFEHPWRELLREQDLRGLRRSVEAAWIGAALPWVALGRTDYVLDRIDELIEGVGSADEVAESCPLMTAWVRAALASVR